MPGKTYLQLQVDDGRTWPDNTAAFLPRTARLR
jgi:hypothetical protein